MFSDVRKKVFKYLVAFKYTEKEQIKTKKNQAKPKKEEAKPKKDQVKPKKEQAKPKKEQAKPKKEEQIQAPKKEPIQKPKKDLAPVRAFLGKALPRLKQMLQDSKATTARMSKIKNWTKFLKENQELTAFQTNTENMVLKMNNLKLNVSDINARIASYEQAKDDLIKESNRVGVRARGGAVEIKLFKELDDLLALYQEAKAELVQTKGALDLVRTQIKVLVGEQRLAELKATTDPLAKSNAAAQDEIKRLQDAVRTAQAEVGEAETKERQTAADKAQAVQGAKAGSIQQLEKKQ
jgi:hypothetical protein